jgi:hypothetical protein
LRTRHVAEAAWQYWESALEYCRVWGHGVRRGNQRSYTQKQKWSVCVIGCPDALAVLFSVLQSSYRELYPAKHCRPQAFDKQKCVCSDAYLACGRIIPELRGDARRDRCSSHVKTRIGEDGRCDGAYGTGWEEHCE